MSPVRPTCRLSVAAPPTKTARPSPEPPARAPCPPELHRPTPAAILSLHRRQKPRAPPLHRPRVPRVLQIRAHKLGGSCPQLFGAATVPSPSGNRSGTVGSVPKPFRNRTLFNDRFQIGTSTVPKSIKTKKRTEPSPLAHHEYRTPLVRIALAACYRRTPAAGSPATLSLSIDV